MNYTKCPNCNSSLTGFISKEKIISDDKTAFINKMLNATKPAYCTACFHQQSENIKSQYENKKIGITKNLNETIQSLSILTCPPPINWEYEVIDMITAQTTSGTGFLTELSRGVNDFLGATSNRSNQKILNAIELCKADLRSQCTKLGGNSIVSIDIDLSEVGSGSSNMLMVCIAGTAIRVTNTVVLGTGKANNLAKIEQLTKDLTEVTEILNEVTIWQFQK